MRKALGRAGWALMTAGALGVSTSAVAQTPQLLPGGNSGHSLPKSEAAQAPAVHSEVAKLEEMKVELALLAEPMTFSFGIAARVHDGALELRGYVPNELIKQKAAQIAGSQTGLAVQDGLQIQRGLAARVPAGSAEELRQNVNAVLLESFGAKAERLAVQTDAQGRVTVTGPALSLEEKLTISKRLRRVHGCTCVDNRLMLADVQRNGKSYKMVSTDGQVLVAPGVVETAAQPTAAAKTPAPKSKPLASEARPTVAATLPAPMTKALPPEPVPAVAASSIPTAPAATAAAPRRNPLRPGSSSTSATTTTTPVATSPSSAMPYMPVPAPTVSKPATTKIDPLTVPSSVQSSPVTWTPATQPIKPVSSYATTGTVTFEKEPTKAAGGAYATTGTVTFDDDPAPSVTIAAPAVKASPAQLKLMIEKGCKSLGKDARVVNLPDGQVEVHLKVRNDKEAEDLNAKINTLPELAPYQMKLLMHVEP